MAWIFPMLDLYGHGDEALKILSGDAYPSLGHMLSQATAHEHCYCKSKPYPSLSSHKNMTTLCEDWACSYHDAGGGSQNHIMLGAS